MDRGLRPARVLAEAKAKWIFMQHHHSTKSGTLGQSHFASL